MPNFLVPFEQVALRKSEHLRQTFDSSQTPEEALLHRLFIGGQHWHSLTSTNQPPREAFAVDGGLRTCELSNGGTLIVAQALILGTALDAALVDIEILSGRIAQKTVDRFTDLFRQNLEVALAAEHICDLPHCGIMYLDGALYGGLPQLYAMDDDGIEDPTVSLIKNYEALFDGCSGERTIISVAKSSRAATLALVLQEDAHVPESSMLRMSDSEMIYRWTAQKAGFSTPVLLGTQSFKGWPRETLLEPGCAVTQMPAILSFLVRLADFDPALRIDVPCRCLGLGEKIADLTARLLDPRLAEPIVAALLADYAGSRVYNPLLFAVDQEVALHRSRFMEVYLPTLEEIMRVKIEPSLSAARFLD